MNALAILHLSTKKLLAYRFFFLVEETYEARAFKIRTKEPENGKA